MIPKVKTWIVTDSSGEKFEIWGPTRRLALLNFRFEGNWQSVRSIGVKRLKGGEDDR